MSLSKVLRRMGELGLSIEEAIELTELLEKSNARAARGTSKAAQRTRKWREKRHEERHETSPGDVTQERHGDVTASCAPVRDITSNSENTGLADAAAAEEQQADDWPDVAPGMLVKMLARTAGPGLEDLLKAPGLTTTGGEITRWKQMHCSWELDVLPIVKARTMRKRRKPVASWIPFTADILAAKRRRLEPLETEAPEEGVQPTLAGRIGAEHAEAKRRALARMAVSHG